MSGFRNFVAEANYDGVLKSNEVNRKRAESIIIKEVNYELQNFYLEHKNYDIFVCKLGCYKNVNLPKKLKAFISCNDYYKDRSFDAYFKNFIFEENYEYENADLKIEKYSGGSGITGYTVSETSSGYSVSPNYSKTEPEITKTFIRGDKKIITSVGGVKLALLRKGTGEEVIKKEEKHKNDSFLYGRAKQYVNDLRSLRRDCIVTKKTGMLYNLSYLFCRLIFFFYIIMLPFCFNGYINKYYFPSITINMFMEKVIASYPYLSILLLLLPVVYYIFYRIMKKIKNDYVDLKIVWYNGWIGNGIFLNKQEKVYNVESLLKWQDNGRFPIIKNRMRILVVMTIIIFSNFMLYIFDDIPFIIEFTKANVFCIIISTIFNLIVGGVILSFIYRIFTFSIIKNTIILINNLNYRNCLLYKNLIEEFIAGNGILEYDNFNNDIMQYMLKY